MRNERAGEAVLAFQASLDAFSKLSNIVGVLACLRLLADFQEGLGERYDNLLASIKERNPDADLSDLEKSLVKDPDSVLRAAVRQVADGDSQTDPV